METPFTPHQLLALNQLGKLVTASLDLDTTLEAIVESADRLTAAQSVALFLMEDDGTLSVRVSKGAIDAAQGGRLRPDQGLVGRALASRQAVLVTDMLAEPRRACPQLDHRLGTRGYIAAPLIWRDEPLGVVTVGVTEAGGLGLIEAALIGELADLAAAAVAHAREYSREQMRRAESERLHQLVSERTATLERVQQQLVQNEKLTAIGQLADGIAHEMNTPLGVILSNLSVLGDYSTGLLAVATAAQQVAEEIRGDGRSTHALQALEASLQAVELPYLIEDVPQLIAESTSSAERLASIVRSVASFAGRATDDYSMVNVAGALEAAVTLTWNTLKHQCQLERALQPAPPVLGRGSELTEVFVHLLLNAAQSLQDPSGVITIGTRQDEEYALVSISDNGCGIPADQLTRVFDPFFTTRGPSQGTGMGLAACHGIVTRHGGTITLESTPGQGTTVAVRLPAAVGVADSAQQAGRDTRSTERSLRSMA